jgi:Polyketide cyclase / dehydrase and lipid transport
MTVSACPADDVDASPDDVWALVDHPDGFDAWWDARTIAAEPPGPLAPGQRIVARAKGVFPARIHIDVVEVDAARRRLQLIARMPFGVVDHMTLTVDARGPDRAFVRFG